MNVRADDLMVTLRALLGGLPGGTSLSVHGAETWALVLIMTSSDDAVIALSEDLELGEVEIRIGSEHAPLEGLHRGHDRGELAPDVVELDPDLGELAPQPLRFFTPGAVMIVGQLRHDPVGS